MRKNILVCTSMIGIVLLTGFVLGLIGLMKFSGNLINDTIAEIRKSPSVLVSNDSSRL